MKKKTIILFLVYFLCALHFNSNTVQASLVESLSLQDLSQRADCILQGVVISTTPQWNDERTKIETLCKIRVLRCLKGDCGEVTSFVRRGGNIDGMNQIVSGEPSLFVGEEIVVFLEEVGDSLRFLGLAQGKYQVQEHNGQKFAVGAAQELRVYDKVKKHAVQYRSQTLPLDDFLNNIAEFVSKKP